MCWVPGACRRPPGGPRKAHGRLWGASRGPPDPPGRVKKPNNPYFAQGTIERPRGGLKDRSTPLLSQTLNSAHSAVGDVSKFHYVQLVIKALFFMHLLIGNVLSKHRGQACRSHRQPKQRRRTNLTTARPVLCFRRSPRHRLRIKRGTIRNNVLREGAAVVSMQPL